MSCITVHPKLPEIGMPDIIPYKLESNEQNQAKYIWPVNFAVKSEIN